MEDLDFLLQLGHSFSSGPELPPLALLGTYSSLPGVSVGDALLFLSPQASGPEAAAWVPFPTVDVPDHAHYTLGTVILLVGLTGTLGNLTVIYTFCRCLVGGAGSRALCLSSHANRAEYNSSQGKLGWAEKQGPCLLS